MHHTTWSEQYQAFLMLCKRPLQKQLRGQRRNQGMDSQGNAPWWNWRCQRAKALRRRAFREFQKCICSRHAELYSKARKECADTLRREKQESWQEFASKCNRTTPLSEIWGQVRSFSSRRNSIHAFPQLVTDNVAITEQNAVSDAFAQHFANESCTNIYPPSTHNLLSNRIEGLDFSSNNQESYNVPFTMNELKLSLTNSDDKTSVGPDGLPYSFFTNLNELNLSTLLIAINNLWTGDTFPDEWLQSTIIPIIKPGRNRQAVESYRPISLTNCACKIMERMINTRLRHYLETNLLLDACQSGFRGHHSTADNLSRLIADIQTNWKHRKSTVAVFLDLTSAFNKVHRATVIDRIHALGIRGHLAHFLTNFLQPRLFSVRCQSTISATAQLEHGVPQGSVLSPTLFLIAINDVFRSLPRRLSSIHYSLFADDLAIWCSHRDCQDSFAEIQRAVDHCVQWCSTWGFFLSAPKSAMVIFKRGPMPSMDHAPRLNNVPIPFHRTHKFLGITLDSRLTFKTHIDDIRTRCFKRLNVLRCLSGFKWGADRRTLAILYKGIIRSVLEYNAYLFSTISLTLCKRLETVQSRCLRLITGAFRTTPILALRADTDIPRLSDRRLFLLLRYYFKVKSDPNHVAIAALGNGVPPAQLQRRGSRTLADAVQLALHEFDIPDVDIAPNPPLTPFWLYNDLSIVYLTTSRKSELSPMEVQTTFLEYRDDNRDSVFYYTDGSAHNNQVGAAATGPDFNFSARLPDFTTVFSAEVYAIKQVLIHIKTKCTQQATICTDSKSTLQALQRTDRFCHPGVYDIHQMVLALAEDQHVTFLWVPGHCGIRGNEMADTLAKEGAALPTPLNEALALGDALHLTKIKFAHYLQCQWEQNNASHMYRIKSRLQPWATCSQDSREREVVLARLRCGHTRITHSHLFDRTIPPVCESCNVRLTVEHILISCPALANARRSITDYLEKQRLENHLSSLIGDNDPGLIDLVLDFILKSPFSGKL